ncbi:hypothetical protein COLO4_01424, partial [Corchorus olitorius]
MVASSQASAPSTRAPSHQRSQPALRPCGRTGPAGALRRAQAKRSTGTGTETAVSMGCALMRPSSRRAPPTAAAQRRAAPSAPRPAASRAGPRRGAGATGRQPGIAAWGCTGAPGPSIRGRRSPPRGRATGWATPWAGPGAAPRFPDARRPAARRHARSRPAHSAGWLRRCAPGPPPRPWPAA